MPHSRCPACRSKHVQSLPAPSKASLVDYYGCARTDVRRVERFKGEFSRLTCTSFVDKSQNAERVRVEQLILQVQERRDYLCEQLKKLLHNIARAKLLVG